MWDRVPDDDFDSWRAQVAPAQSVVSAAQLAAVRQSERYVTITLAAQGIDVAPEGLLNPTGFVGMPNGGPPVRVLMDLPRIRALEAVQNGATSRDALAIGRDRLDRYASTLVQDAGRAGDSVATFVRPRVGWVRMVNPPCCKDCAIQAGRWFRSNQGFQRHPKCDCVHVPAAEDTAQDVSTNVTSLFQNGQVTGLRPSQERAISSGADPISVVNADRRRSDDRMSTTAAARKGSTRLTPEGIYAQAGENREIALSLLQQHGYIR